MGRRREVETGPGLTLKRGKLFGGGPDGRQQLFDGRCGGAQGYSMRIALVRLSDIHFGQERGGQTGSHEDVRERLN